MIRVLTTIRRAPLERVVHRARCEDCGQTWSEQWTEAEARAMSKGHKCGESS